MGKRKVTILEPAAEGVAHVTLLPSKMKEER